RPSRDGREIPNRPKAPTYISAKRAQRLVSLSRASASEDRAAEPANTGQAHRQARHARRDVSASHDRRASESHAGPPAAPTESCMPIAPGPTQLAAHT